MKSREEWFSVMKIEIHLFRCSAIPCFKGSRAIGPFEIGLTAFHFYTVFIMLNLFCWWV